MENALKESEENFRRRNEELEKLMELTPVPIFIAHDPDCRLITCNRAAGTLFQAMEGENVSVYSPAGQTVQRRFFRNGLQLTADELPLRYASRHGIEVKDQEIEVLLPDDDRSTILGSATPLRDSDGSIRGCIGAFIDITKLKQAEEEARAQKEILEKAFESSPYLMMLVDRDGRLIKVNRSFSALSERAKEGTHDILGSEAFSCLESFDGATCWKHPRCSSCPVRKRIVRCLETGESVYNAEERMTIRKGSIDIALDMLISTAPVKYGASEAVLVTIMDITERRRAEETIRKSEERFRELAENIREVFWVCTPGRLLYISPACEEMCGRSCESLYERPESFLELIHPEDKDRTRQACLDHLKTLAPLEGECRIIRPDGAIRWIRARSFPVTEKGRVVRSVGIAEDVTTLKEAEEFLRIERDLALGLGAAESLNEAMKLLLEACLRLDSFDAGGIYLAHGKTGALRLICHRGLSESFVERVSFYEAGSRMGRFAMGGRPGYRSRPADFPGMEGLFEWEDLMTLALIPVRVGTEVVALLSVASHVQPEIPDYIRGELETIATHIGAIVSRVRLGETVKAQGELLQEANTALRVLLKQREADRKELEESLLNNVKHLVLPYVEKLKKSGLTVDQGRFLEVLESHLLDITSPFVQKLSAPMLGLTPAEIRVADLIRQGKSSKEIADLLGISEWAVVFHRRGIRKKLGLSGKKLNLQTYLGTLE